MQRYLALLLIAILLLSLAGCSAKTPINESETQEATSNTNSAETLKENTPSISSSPSTPSNEEPTPSEPVETKLDMSRISSAYRYSNGYTFVKLDDSYASTYCIDKSGNIIFTLPRNYSLSYGFHNGIAILDDGIDNYICDTEGNLTSAIDLGVTKIRDDFEVEQIMFEAGYILVEVVESDFTGSKTKLGVLNSSLEYIVEPSAELYEKYTNEYQYRFFEFYDGYLFTFDEDYQTDKYLDFHTGKEESGLKELMQNLVINYESDFWEKNGCRYYDKRYGKDYITIDLSENEDTLWKNSLFSEGTAYLEFRVGSGSNEEAFFTIIRENGQFNFEPIKLKSTNYSITQDKGVYMIRTDTKNGPGSIRTIEIFDTSGKLGEMEISSSETAILSDNAILIIGENHRFYDLSCEPLF